jgi:hypothetical protein
VKKAPATKNPDSLRPGLRRGRMAFDIAAQKPADVKHEA